MNADSAPKGKSPLAERVVELEATIQDQKTWIALLEAKIDHQNREATIIDKARDRTREWLKPLYPKVRLYDLILERFPIQDGWEHRVEPPVCCGTPAIITGACERGLDFTCTVCSREYWAEPLFGDVVSVIYNGPVA